MLRLIDRLAGMWMDWRIDRYIQTAGLDQDFAISRLEAQKRGWTLTATTQMIAVIADQAAAFLDEHNAENYVQMDMLPRLDRGLRPVRITVAWANGEQPAKKAARLQSENESLKTEVERLRDELSAQSEAVQRDWLSPAEGAAVKAEIDRLKGLLGECLTREDEREEGGEGE